MGEELSMASRFRLCSSRCCCCCCSWRWPSSLATNHAPLPRLLAGLHSSCAAVSFPAPPLSLHAAIFSRSSFPSSLNLRFASPPAAFLSSSSAACSPNPSTVGSPAASATSVSTSNSDDEYLPVGDSTVPQNFFSQLPGNDTDPACAHSATEAEEASSPLRCISSLETELAVSQMEDPDILAKNGDEELNNYLLPFSEPADIYIPVKAFFLSRRIDLKCLGEEPFSGIIPSRNNFIIKWKDRPPGSPPFPGKPGKLHTSRYVVVFNYGAVVLFNFGENEEEECLDIIRRHCTEEQCEEARKDDFDVLVRHNLDGWSMRGHDKIILKRITADNVRIISSILGQSIALDHYGRKVDNMVNIFSDLNQGMEKTGTFTMDRKELFKVVAGANSTLADVILRIGILERSDAAWKDAKYAALWEILRDEFELEQRFASFDFKLEIIQHNVRFFLEVLQNRKSAFLEWTIIFLIAGEILVGLYQILHDLGYW